MAKISNDNELEAEMSKMLQKVARYVAEQMLELNKRAIEDVVYNTYSPLAYIRSEEFKDAWKVSEEPQSSGAKAGIEYAPEYLTVGSNNPISVDYGRHASIVTGNSSAAYLADIIYQGLSGSAWISPISHKKRNAWEALNKMLGIRKMKKLIEDGFAKEGVLLHKHNSPVRRTYS